MKDRERSIPAIIQREFLLASPKLDAELAEFTKEAQAALAKAGVAYFVIGRAKTDTTLKLTIFPAMSETERKKLASAGIETSDGRGDALQASISGAARGAPGATQREPTTGLSRPKGGTGVGIRKR